MGTDGITTITDGITIITITIAIAMITGLVTILIMTIITVIRTCHEETPVPNFPEDPDRMVRMAQIELTGSMDLIGITGIM